MHTEPNTQSAETGDNSPREPWVTPVILSYDAVEITRAANLHPGDFINSLDS